MSSVLVVIDGCLAFGNTLESNYMILEDFPDMPHWLLRRG